MCVPLRLANIVEYVRVCIVHTRPGGLDTLEPEEQAPPPMICSYFIICMFLGTVGFLTPPFHLGQEGVCKVYGLARRPSEQNVIGNGYLKGFQPGVKVHVVTCMYKYIPTTKPGFVDFFFYFFFWVIKRTVERDKKDFASNKSCS